jgi:peptidoglycan/xylan/chitin deacetylase (PgdA/CDA1 family)
MAQMLRDFVVRTATAALGRAFSGGAGAVLMLHRVRPATWSADPGANITPETFRALIAGLQALGYDIVSLDDGLVRLAGGGKRFACLTFDDGYRDNHDILWPLARELNVPIAIYLTTGYVGRTAPAPWLLLEALVGARHQVLVDGHTYACATDDEKTAAYKALLMRLPTDAGAARSDVLKWIATHGLDAEALCRDMFMDWTMAARMQTDPLVTFGAHTVNHPHLSALPEDEARREITDSCAEIARHIGVTPRHFAYPFGMPSDCGTREEHLAQAAGFASAARATGGPLRHVGNAMALPRIGFGGQDTVANLALRLSTVRAFLKAS